MKAYGQTDIRMHYIGYDRFKNDAFSLFGKLFVAELNCIIMALINSLKMETSEETSPLNKKAVKDMTDEEY